MPPKKVYRSKPKNAPKRKYFRRKRRYVKKIQAKPSFQPAIGVPAVYRKLTYVYKSNFQQTTVNQCYGHIFRANSCFDPVYAIGGGQPRGFDQYMAMYSFCQVLGGRATVTVIPRASAAIPGMCILALSELGTILTDPIDYLERPHHVMRFVPPDLSRTTKLSINYNVAKYFQIKDLQDEDDLKHSDSGDPARQLYLHLAFVNTDTTTVTDTTDFVIKFEFFVRFSTIRQVNAS